jgi:peptidoglycan hydrolase-like protein with peptidoglycan-binding domain
MPTELQRKWIQALGGSKSSQPPTAEKRSNTHGNRPPGSVKQDPGANSVPGDRDTTVGRPGDVDAVAGGEGSGGEPAAASSTVHLGGSVGAGGRNAKADVLSVQAALNRQMKAGLAEDGVCGKKTIDAITAFQKKLKFKRPDGRVDPGGPTEKALNGSSVAPASDPDERSDRKGGSRLKEEGPARKSGDNDLRGGASGEPEPDFSRLARQIHDATEGVGTDEQAIFAALRELKGSAAHRARLGQVYREMFGDDLEAVLRDELNDAERAKADDAAKSGGGGGPNFESLARQIHDATEGVGTDEAAVNAALAQVKGRPEHMAKLRAVYRSMFGQSLDDVLRDELSGAELNKAQSDLDPRREVIPDHGLDEVEVIRHSKVEVEED